MRINLVIIGMIAAVCSYSAVSAQNQNISLAPLNPEFVKMVDNSRRGLQGPVLRTPEGHGLGLLPSPVDFSHLVGRDTGQKAALRAVTNTTYDLRSLGRVTPVKNQGVYGTCWAFASYGSLESCLLYSLSETNDFSENNLANLSGFDYGFDGGGFSIMTTAYLARWLGPIDETTDPYPNPDNSTTNPPVKHVQSVEIIGRRRSSIANDEVKQAVYDKGALVVGMYIDLTYYNTNTYAYFLPTPTYANHAVAIVGWNDQYSRTNFVSSYQPSGDGAFIVRNSWGTSWGESGYFYVSYYDTVFARNVTEANFLFLNGEAANLYSQIYQYDPLGWVGSIGYGSSNAWQANIFTATNAGELKMASFYAPSTNAAYTIYAYAGVSASEPRSGTLLLNQSGSFTNAGYYTVTFSSPIALNAGDAFSVVVNLRTPAYNYPIAVEYALSGYSSQAAASPGQSFVSSDGSSWTDTTASDSTMNVCLKAFLRTTTYPYSAPSSFSATRGTYLDKVSLIWNEVAGATNYSIYRNTQNSVLDASLLATIASSSYDDSNITRGQTYYYWVKAIGASGTSDYSLASYGYAQLSPPPSLSATEGTSVDKVQLSWNASSGAGGYIVCRSQANSSSSAAEIDRSSAVSYNDVSASPGNRYYYWVKAYSSSCTSSFSSGTTGYRGLSAPGGVSASKGNYFQGVSVSWNAVSGAISYRVLRSSIADSSSAASVGETAGTSLMDTSANPGVSYYYWLQSKKWTMVSPYSTSYDSGWRRSMAAGENARGDFDGDGIMDFAVYQEATGLWYIRLSGSGYATITYQLGCPGFSPVPCDYDADGKVDPAIYNRYSGLWMALLSGSGNTPAYGVLGGVGFDPVTGDFDGDGRADAVVYQEATGTWQGLLSTRNYEFVSSIYGGPGCKQVAADYDGDGKADAAVYYERLNQNLAYWYMALSGSGYASHSKTTAGLGYVPVPADYDGDGKADLAIYNSVSGLWNYWSSLNNYSFPIAFTLGGSGYTAVPGDYDGDSKADIAVYREATGTWLFLLSASDYASAYGELGGEGFKPVGAVR